MIRDSANLPTLTLDNNISMRVRMIIQTTISTTLNNGLHLKVVVNSFRLGAKLIKIILLNSKIDFQSIRFCCWTNIKQIKRRNTGLIHSRNIRILGSIKIRRCTKTLRISKRTLRTQPKTTNEIITIILVTCTICCIQFLHILLTKTSTIITHCK